MHTITKSFTLRYFCPPGDFKVKVKVTKSLFFRAKVKVKIAWKLLELAFSFQYIVIVLRVWCKMAFDGDVSRRPSYGVYISQLIRLARVCNHVTDFNARNKCLTAKLLQQGYRYHKLRKTFSKFYRRHYELISKYNVGLKTLSTAEAEGEVSAV